MPWTAISEKTGKHVNLALKQVQSTFFNTNVFKDAMGHKFICPNCGNKVSPVKRANTRIYFRHAPIDHNKCTEKLVGYDNSNNHFEAVCALCQYLEDKYKENVYRNLYGETYLLTEYSFKNISRRADIVLFNSENKPIVVHEVQISKISSEEVESRTNDYESIDLECIWHFGLAAALDKNLTEWFIRKYGYLDTCITVFDQPERGIAM